MTTTSSSKTRTPARPPAGRSRSSRPTSLIVVTLVALAAAALVAVAVGLAGGGTADTSTSFDTTGSATEGATLAPLPEAGADPAVGQPAPVVEGTDRDGATVEAPTPGRPTVLLFLAHWCPHCRREVPALQQWIDDGELPTDVDLAAVATGIDPELPNYPPSAWLDSEDWAPRTIADANGAAAEAYGLTSFPYWVAVDADGTVVERRSGELSLDEVVDMTAAARGR